MPSGYEQAASAYNTTQSSAMSGFEILVELYKGMIGNINQAKAAYQNGKLDEMCNLNDKTFKIIQALRAHLDFDQGGDTSLFLDQFYSKIFIALTKVLSQDEPEKAFDAVLAEIQPVYERWVALAAEEKAVSQASQVPATEQPTEITT